MYDKAKAAIDWICINCHLFDESLNSWDTNSAQSIFQDRIGLCNGYSEAFYVMMTELGVPCQKITGQVGTYDHAWITVMMDDGKWYYLDTNNIDANIDDQYGDDITGENIYYELFLMPYSKMGNYHPDQTLPTPYGDSFDYQNRAIEEQKSRSITELKKVYQNSDFEIIELGGKDTISIDIINAMKNLVSGKKYVFISTVIQKGMEINWYEAAKQLYTEMSPSYGYELFFIMSETQYNTSKDAYALEFTYISEGNTYDALYESYDVFIGVNGDGTLYDTNSYYTQDY